MAMAIPRPRGNRWLLWLVGTVVVIGAVALFSRRLGAALEDQLGARQRAHRRR